MPAVGDSGSADGDSLSRTSTTPAEKLQLSAALATSNDILEHLTKSDKVTLKTLNVDYFLNENLEMRVYFFNFR